MISGNKKGSGSSSSKSDTLKSKAKAQLLDLISEGPIVGLIDGAKSIYLNETQVINDDDEENFKNVVWEEHTGLADEGYFTNNTGVETPYTVNVQVKEATGPVVRTINETNATAVKVLISIPALFRVKNGALKATSLSYAIDVKPAGGVWTEKHLEELVKEKTTSQYQKIHRIELPEGGAPWDIRVRRITADSEEDELSNDMYFDSYYVVVDGKFIYPHSAIISLQINAEDVGSSIPNRAYKVKGLIISVPTNYDPETRVYSGIWDGTFKQAWTDNPAWIFYDLVKNDRYGLGEFVDIDGIDKWSLYNIAKYCDEMVPSGFKDQYDNIIYEPRYTFNGVISSRQDAFNYLRQVATAWRGMTYWSLGQVFAVADMPSDPVQIVGPSNVENGRFNYTSTGLKSRHSVAAVTWNDPNDFYRPAVEIYVDDEALKKYGWKEKTVSYLGCTSRGLARRYAKWIIDVENNEKETVNYVASFDHSNLRPGDIITIADPNKSEIVTGGRLVSYNGADVSLDRPFIPETGKTYYFATQSSNNEVVYREISSYSNEVFDEDGTSLGYMSVTFTTAIDANGEEYADNPVFAITDSETSTKQYRVLFIKETEPNKFSVTALEHDVTKYDRIEEGIEFDENTYTRPSVMPPKPTNPTFVESLYTLAGQNKSNVSISWTNPDDSRVAKYSVSYDSVTTGLVNLGYTESTSLDLDLEPDDYTFYIYSVGYSGIYSNPLEYAITVNGWEGADSPLVTAIKLVDRPGSTQFVGKNINITWTNTLPITATESGEVINDLYDYNEVKIYNHTTGDLLRTEIVRGNNYTYSYDANKADNEALIPSQSACRNIRFEIVLYDTVGRNSATASQVFTNTQPPAIVPTITNIVDGIVISYVTPSDEDFEGVKIWMQPTSGFDPLTTLPSYVGKSNSVTLTGDPGAFYYIRMGTYDAFDQNSINISPESSVEITTIIVDTTELETDIANLETDLANLGVDVANNTSLITAVQAAANDATATGLFKVQAVTAPTGVEVRLALYARVDSGGTYYHSGMFIDLIDDGLGGYTSTITMLADQIKFTDGSTDTAPFAFIGTDFIFNGVMRNATNTRRIDPNGGTFLYIDAT